jgi:hypothetical protein
MEPGRDSSLPEQNPHLSIFDHGTDQAEISLIFSYKIDLRRRQKSVIFKKLSLNENTNQHLFRITCVLLVRGKELRHNKPLT